ncbi:TPA: stage V sporulation protein E, partial [Candidatus Beckwithbacteria bacterium]|nr:stage V sporulation protein E [Candidatus Beckwithbacteria bacterium]
MIKKLTVSPKAKKPDPMLLGLTLVLTFFGLLMVFNASVVEAFQIFDDKYYFSKLQLTWIGAGLAAMAAAAFLPLRLVKKLATPTILVTLVLLGLVLIPGVGS